MGETSRIWKQGLLGVPAAYQHPPDCRRWSARSVPPHVFRLPNNMLVPHFEIGEFYWGKKRSLCTSWIMQDEHHAKLMPLPAKLLNYISLPYASAMLCLQLYVRVWMSHDSAQLVFWEMKRSLSLPLYLISEMIGILMDYAGQSTSNAQAHLLSNQEDVVQRWVNVNEAKQCCQWHFKLVKLCLVLFEHLSGAFTSSLEKY